MKKDVTETRTFCDFCEEPGYTQCILCDKDLCPKHRIEVVIYLDRQDWSFRASLCQEDAQPLVPFLERLKGKNYHVDILAKDGEIKKAVVSYRTAELEGLGFCLKTTTEKPEYLDMAVTIVKRLGLSYNCFFQVMGDKLLEVGSRSAGSVPIGRDLVLGAIELYEGQEPNPRVEQCTMLRHWVPMFIEETK